MSDRSRRILAGIVEYVFVAFTLLAALQAAG
jgi:hypothetical protein